MHITRCQDQKLSTLEEFYGKGPLPQEARPYECDDRGVMISLLERLRALPDSRRIYGLTADYELCFLAQDSQTAPAFVKVSTVGLPLYFIEYLMPQRSAPWPQQAYVTGMTDSEEEAVKMVLIGMAKSEGWGQMAA